MSRVPTSGGGRSSQAITALLSPPDSDVARSACGALLRGPDGLPRDTPVVRAFARSFPTSRYLRNSHVSAVSASTTLEPCVHLHTGKPRQPRSCEPGHIRKTSQKRLTQQASASGRCSAALLCLYLAFIPPASRIALELTSRPNTVFVPSGRPE